MAEVLGVAASGVALAQVAGQILTTSLAIKRLIDDIKELPETFKLLLNQVDILTPVLVEASSTNVGSLPPSGPLCGALDAAAIQCSVALGQLRDLATELSQQLEQSRGMKRRLIAVKIALRNDTMQKLEKRLSQAVQLLSIAQQTYLLSLQRMQPGLLASLIVNELEARKQSASTSLPVYASTAQPPLLKEMTCTATRSPSLRIVRREVPQEVRTIRLGLARVTGVVDVEIPVSSSYGKLPQKRRNSPTDERSVFGLKLRLPSWLSWKIVDSMVYQSQVGWTHHMRVYNVFGPGPDTPFEKARSAILADDMRILERYFADRVLTPLDRSSAGLTLLNMAIIYNAWTVCDYLLQHGASLDKIILFRKHHGRHAPRLTHDQLNRLIQRERLDDRTLFTILVYADPPKQALQDLRRSLWPDSVFFSEAFYDSRTQLVSKRLLCNSSTPHGVVDFLDVVLYNNGELDLGDTGSVTSEATLRFRRRILLALAREIARCIVLNPCGPFTLHMRPGDLIRVLSDLGIRPYTSLIKDFLTSVMDSDKSNKLPYSITPPPCLHGTLQATILEAAHYLYMLYPSLPNRTRCSMSSALGLVEAALHVWLYGVKSAGVDLVSYAEAEIALSQGIFERRYRIGGQWRRSGRGEFKARLLGFTYGANVEDWKLWWTEVTDGFVGEFWRTVECDTPLLPGSWVDDEDYEDNDNFKTPAGLLVSRSRILRDALQSST